MLRDPGLIPLSHQHQHGLALAVLIDRGLKGDAPPEKAVELARKVAAMADAELLAHFRIEEETLFPTVRGFLEAEDVVDQLIEQHREMESLIESIARSSGLAQSALLKQFGELLSRHIRIEERQLFEEIQAKLPASQMGKLGRQIEEQVQKVCPAGDVLPWENPR
jgi:hemerythrin-like domain-containing protein